MDAHVKGEQRCMRDAFGAIRGEHNTHPCAIPDPGQRHRPTQVIEDILREDAKHNVKHYSIVIIV